MVLLEAAVAGLPIVTVRFGSVNDALPPERLHVVDQTVEGLAQGMRDFLDGRVSTNDFDAEAYNALALREFVTAIDSELESSAAADGVGRLDAP
jgi:CDP-glycerol glycerophosphotransferase